MRIFKITKDIEVVCESQSTRSGFRHLATLLINGIEKANAKCCYQNRTWERYEFQSVLSAVVEKTDLSDQDIKLCKEFISGDRTDWSEFKMVSAIAKIGDLIGEDQKGRNDWKKRMLKAGLESKGLIMPDDWDSLPEDVKEVRLNAVIKLAGGNHG